MKVIVAMMGISLFLALFAREFNWRVRSLLFVGLIAMLAVLILNG